MGHLHQQKIMNDKVSTTIKLIEQFLQPVKINHIENAYKHKEHKVRKNVLELNYYRISLFLKEHTMNFQT